MQSWIMYLCTVLETQVVENVTMAIGWGGDRTTPWLRR